MQTFDFSRSFLTFRVDLQEQAAITLSHKPPTTLNNARIQIECVCALTHLDTNVETNYVLGASCKTERVGADRDLWLEPNADFCLVASPDDFLIIKSWQRRDMGIKRHPETLGVQTERQVGKVREAWTAFRVDMAPVAGHPLESVDAIIDATFRNAPLVARTEYEEAGYRVRLDYPVKTFNVSEREQVYQTDTGPIIVPNLSVARQSTATALVDCFDHAYAAFNNPHWIEFIVNVPTPVGAGISVNHYAQARRIDDVQNSLIEIA